MNPSFSKSMQSFLLQFIIVAGLSFGVHSYLWSYFGVETEIVIPIWQIYAFLSLVVIFIYTWIAHQYSQGKTEIFNYFMGGTLLKMILALLFLLPVFFSDLESKRPDVFNFFAPYFVFLAFEVFIITKLMNQKTE